MTLAGDDFERTIEFGEAALQRIKAFRHPAQPRNYEFWFTYATGLNAALNEAINQRIASQGKLSPEEAETLFQFHIAPNHFSRKVDTMGGVIADEINQVMAMIDVARGSATDYDRSLNGFEKSLEQVDKDGDQVRLIIESLVQATRDMQQANIALESRLTEARQEMLSLQLNLEAIRAEAMTDPLTGMSNRKYFDSALERMLSAAEAGGQPFSLLMVDIDHFKSFNDRYGHLVGDQVLRAVAISLMDNTKGHDVAARYGGEEFAILLPETPTRAATTLAEHIRRTIAGKALMRQPTKESLGRMTISVGVASYHLNDTAQSLIDRCDHCLYAAKNHGRNRVISEQDPEALSTAVKSHPA